MALYRVWRTCWGVGMHRAGVSMGTIATVTGLSNVSPNRR